MVPGTTFWAKGWFLVDFGTPQGTQKWPKIGPWDWKFMKHAVCNKSWWKRGPWDHFLGQGLIFGRFWDPKMTQKLPKIGPWDWKLGFNWPGGSPGSPKSQFWSILGPFWSHFGSPDGHLGTFLGRFWEQPAANSSKDKQIATKSGKLQQKAANRSKLRQTAASRSK